jgi:hypothetical protein
VQICREDGSGVVVFLAVPRYVADFDVDVLECALECVIMVERVEISHQQQEGEAKRPIPRAVQHQCVLPRRFQQDLARGVGCLGWKRKKR